MKYIKLFEAFSKDYMKKIDLKDFKKIKKGAKLMYMGGKVEVLDNNGYVLKLKGEDDRIFMVNKSQFDHGGMTMRESVNELRSDMISGTSGRRTESLEDRKYELKKDAKGATIGNFSNVTLPKGTIIYNLPGGVFADHFSLKNKYASKSSQGPQYFDKPTFKGIMIKQTPAVLSYIEKNSKVLESFDTEVNEGKIELALNKIEKWMPEDQDVQQEYYDIIDKGNVKGMEEFLDIHADEEVLKTFGIKYKDLGKLAKAAIEESVVNEASDQQRLNHLRKLGIAPNNQPQSGAYIKSVSKPGKFFVDWKDAFDLGDVALEFVKSVGSISEFDIIDLNTMKRTGKQLDVKKGQLGNLRTTYGVRVNESSAKDGGDKSNGNSHHEHHLEEDIEAMWKKTYGENFSSKYPAVAKIVKQRKIKDKRELKRIWDETYGENFEEQYPALYNKLD